MNYTITKEMTVSKIKADVKATMIEKFIEFLAAEYGAENVGMVRTGNASKVNEIAVIVGEAGVEGGATNPIVVTVNPSTKEFAERQTANKTYEPFDFVAARDAYDTYVEETVAKAEAAAAAKEAKKAKDAAAREAKAKAKADTEF